MARMILLIVLIVLALSGCSAVSPEIRHLDADCYAISRALVADKKPGSALDLISECASLRSSELEKERAYAKMRSDHLLDEYQ